MRTPPDSAGFIGRTPSGRCRDPIGAPGFADAIVVTNVTGWRSPEAVVDLQLSARAGRACTIVQVSGEIDMDTSPRLQDVLREVADGGGARQVVLDFAEVTFMDSTGLGLLVVWLKTLQDKGGRLCLAAVQDPVRTVLVLSAVDQVVDLYDTVEAAEADMPPLVS